MWLLIHAGIKVKTIFVKEAMLVKLLSLMHSLDRDQTELFGAQRVVIYHRRILIRNAMNTGWRNIDIHVCYSQVKSNFARTFDEYYVAIPVLRPSATVVTSHC